MSGDDHNVHHCWHSLPDEFKNPMYFSGGLILALIRIVPSGFKRYYPRADDQILQCFSDG